MGKWEEKFLKGFGAKWKGLDEVLGEIAKRSPGIRLEHTDLVEGERPAWMQPARKIMTVEKWLKVVYRDIVNAPTEAARRVITGPFYFWDTDDLGRAVVAANDFGRTVIMFTEVWAGEPEF